jgi:hypothetical protein
MDDVPDRAIIDLEATLGELRNQLRIVKSFSGPAAQATRGALRKSRSAMATHLVGRNAARLAQPLHLRDVGGDFSVDQTRSAR